MAIFPVICFTIHDLQNQGDKHLRYGNVDYSIWLTKNHSLNVKTYIISQLDRRNNWSYQPPHGPVSNEQPPKPQHFQSFDKAYPKTLESLAEKVHPFCPGGQSSTGRRMSATTTQQQYRRNNIPISGSDQYLPRSEYDYGNSELKRKIQMF